MRETTGNNQSQPFYVNRDARSLNVGDCLVVDGKVLDFTIRHPETGKPVQMILIVMIDWASRCPVGWQLMPTADTTGIKAAFRRSVINLGKFPEAVYLDSNKGIISKFLEEDLSGFDGLLNFFDSFGTTAHCVQPYNGSAKVTECFSRTVETQLECLMPSYCGSYLHLKPAHMNRNDKFLKAWHELRPKAYVPTILETSRMIEAYLGWLVNQPHEGLEGCTPLDVFVTGRGPDTGSMQRGHSLLWAAFRPVRRCRVTLHGNEYESDCLNGIDAKANILVKYDTSDLETVYCYLPDGEYLGAASLVPRQYPLATLAKDMADQSIMGNVMTSLKRKARLQKDAREALLKLGPRCEDGSETPGSEDN